MDDDRVGATAVRTDTCPGSLCSALGRGDFRPCYRVAWSAPTAISSPDKRPCTPPAAPPSAPCPSHCAARHSTRNTRLDALNFAPDRRARRGWPLRSAPRPSGELRRPSRPRRNRDAESQGPQFPASPRSAAQRKKRSSPDGLANRTNPPLCYRSRSRRYGRRAPGADLPGGSRRCPVDRGTRHLLTPRGAASPARAHRRISGARDSMTVQNFEALRPLPAKTPAYRARLPAQLGPACPAASRRLSGTRARWAGRRRWGRLS